MLTPTPSPSSDLINTEKLILEKVRSTCKARPLLDLEASTPFEIFPENFNGKKAVILIHGFLGTPYFMRSLAKFYAAEGYYCYVPTLLGHGACPEAMRCYSLEALLDSLNQAIDTIHSQIKTLKEIHLCGFSLGALLALLIAKNRPISSLTLLAPALGITPLAKLIPPLERLGFGNIHNPSAASLNGLHNPAMYAWHPLCGVLPIIDGIKEVNTSLNTWDKTPIFMVASVSDAVVKLEPILNLFSRNQHPDSHLRLYGPANFSPLPAKASLIQEDLLEPRVKSLSHVSLGISPLDNLLGAHSPQYKNLPTNAVLGEKLPSYIFSKNIFRLFYNPDFDGLTQNLGEFLQKITCAS